MKKLLMGVSAWLSVAMVFAQEPQWRGLDADNYYSGPKLTAAALAGKVVLVDEWGVNCPPCRALLPRMQELWRSFGGDRFVLIGSHRQGRDAEKVAALVKANGLTYSIYQGAGLVGEPDSRVLPFLYVVDAFGKVVYSGSGEREATEALVNAITAAPSPDSLLGAVELKLFKPLAKTMVFGQNVEGKLPALRSAAKNPGTPAGQEAAMILAAVEAANKRIASRIRADIENRPGVALTDIGRFGRTWPSQKGEFADAAAKLSAEPDVGRLQRLAAAIDKLRKKPPRNSGQAKTALTQARSLRKSNEALAAAKNPAVSGEASMLFGEIDELIAGFESQLPAPRRAK